MKKKKTFSFLSLLVTSCLMLKPIISDNLILYFCIFITNKHDQSFLSRHFLFFLRGNLFEFKVKLFKSIGDFQHIRVVSIVLLGVVPHFLNIWVEKGRFFINVVGQFELNGLQIYRVINDGVVFRGTISFLVNRLEKGNNILVFFQLFQNLNLGTEFFLDKFRLELLWTVFLLIFLLKMVLASNIIIFDNLFFISF